MKKFFNTLPLHGWKKGCDSSNGRDANTNKQKPNWLLKMTQDKETKKEGKNAKSYTKNWTRQNRNLIKSSQWNSTLYQRNRFNTHQISSTFNRSLTCRNWNKQQWRTLSSLNSYPTQQKTSAATVVTVKEEATLDRERCFYRVSRIRA